MAERLKLDPTGMKNPLDINVVPDAPVQAPAPAPAPAAGRTEPKPARRRVSRTNSAAPVVAQAKAEELAQADRTPTTGPVEGFGGYPIQTSIQMDVELLDRADALAREAGISLTTLLLAALCQELPANPAAAAELAITERGEYADAIRIERNLRIARDLRSRLDELVAPYERSLRGARSLLINAILRERIPDSAHAAKALAQAYVRQQTLAALHLNV